MSKFKEKLNKELSYLKVTDTANDIINKAESKNKIITMQRAVAMVAALVLVFTIIFIPTNSNKNSFVIIANAESSADSATTGDELNTDNFVEIKSDEPNLVTFNFSYAIDKNAPTEDIVQKYLFYSFSKGLDIAIKGDGIKTVTYKINNGTLVSYSIKEYDNRSVISNTGVSDGNTQTEFTIDYDEYNYTHFVFGPSHNSDNDSDIIWYKLLETGEITTETIVSNDPGDVIGIGVMEEDTLVTDEEFKTLKQYAENDDKVGFYNFQNQIFKRLIDSITLDVTITKTNGKTETQSVEFLYTPDILTELPNKDETNPNSAFFNNMLTLSSGTLSARIKS